MVGCLLSVQSWCPRCLALRYYNTTAARFAVLYPYLKHCTPRAEIPGDHGKLRRRQQWRASIILFLISRHCSWNSNINSSQHASSSCWAATAWAWAEY